MPAPEAGPETGMTLATPINEGFQLLDNAPGGTRTGKGEATGPATTVPYVLGNILTFKLLDGSNLVFNCATEDVWFEPRTSSTESAQRGPEVFLDGLLAHPDAPELFPSQPSLLPANSFSRTATPKECANRSRCGRAFLKEITRTSARRDDREKGVEACLLLTGQVESQSEQDRVCDHGGQRL